MVARLGTCTHIYGDSITTGCGRLIGGEDVTVEPVVEDVLQQEASLQSRWSTVWWERQQQGFGRAHWQVTQSRYRLPLALWSR